MKTDCFIDQLRPKGQFEKKSLEQTIHAIDKKTARSQTMYKSCLKNSK